MRIPAGRLCAPAARRLSWSPANAGTPASIPGNRPMSEEKKPLEVLEAQITALQDTHRNVTGLIEKLTRVRSELDEVEFGEFAGKLREPFLALSASADKLHEIAHDMEIERNRRRNEE